MNSTLIPRDTLMSSLIQKSAAAADRETGQLTAAAEAIANADAYLHDAVLPTYTELLETLRRLTVCYDRYSATGRRHEIPAVNAWALLERHDATIAGNFKG